MKTSAIDLFCGIGGLSYGLKKAGISVVAGLDLDESCTYAFEENINGKFIKKDIISTKGTDLQRKYWSRGKKYKILVGCAPCQPFSPHSNKDKYRQKNKKWHLLDEFKRIIGETNPDIVTMENVPNLAKRKIFREFVDFLKNHKYSITYSNVYCPDFGIPQKRRRLVLLASKYGEISLITKTHTKETYVTLKQAIGKLPVIAAGNVHKKDPLHRTAKLSKINLQRIKASSPNGTWLDWGEELRLACHKKEEGKSYKAVYGRMSWSEPSSTITTQFYNYGTGRFGHPTQNRAITIREAAILQTFPKKYRFYKNESDIGLKKFGIQIGNAVPVRLGYIIGKSILQHLEGQHGKKR